MRTALCAPPIYDTLCESAPDSVSIAFRAIVMATMIYPGPYALAPLHKSWFARPVERSRSRESSRSRFAILSTCLLRQVQKFYPGMRERFILQMDVLNTDLSAFVKPSLRSAFSRGRQNRGVFKYQRSLGALLSRKKKGRETARHPGTSGVRKNIFATRELRVGDFVKGKRERRASRSVCKSGFDIVDAMYGSKGPKRDSHSPYILVIKSVPLIKHRTFASYVESLIKGRNLRWRRFVKGLL